MWKMWASYESFQTLWATKEASRNFVFWVLLEKNILPIPLSSSRWPLNSQHPLPLRMGKWGIRREGTGATGPWAWCIFPSHPAVQTAAVRPRAPGSQGSHSCARTIPSSCVPLTSRNALSLCPRQPQAHCKAHLLQEGCPHPQSTVPSHLRTPRVFVIQSSGGFQRSCFVWYCFTSAGLICEWLELRVCLFCTFPWSLACYQARRKHLTCWWINQWMNKQMKHIWRSSCNSVPKERVSPKLG